MAKIIFTSGVDPKYDDIPEVRCEFPRRYLKMVTEAIGDWVIYYEPRKNGGRLSYYASARVNRVEAHPITPDSFYMYVSDYLEFTNPVPFREGAFYYEEKLRSPNDMPNLGALQWAVRRLPEEEFSVILKAGFVKDIAVPAEEASVVREEPEIYARPTVQQIIERPFRDRIFSENVHAAYDETCAFTGLRLNNGAGLFEVHAAHIRAVEDLGPDSTRNGMALAQTIHWLFDAGVLSLEDDGKILQAGRLVPEKIKRLLNSDGYARLPDSILLRPHAQFLRFHRENRFRG